jgi:SAM-dependent methyltransferase
MNIHDKVARWWDADAPTYDRSADHVGGSATERAAWTAALARHLPPPPARVLDVGAGTGFLALTLARLGHRVTALDLSRGMLDRLRASADREGLEVTVVEGRADQPPEGPFDVVVERHLLWTLPDPGAALAAWRRVAPDGRLVVLEGLWGAADQAEALRSRARRQLRRLRRAPSDHHARYDPAVLADLPLAGGTHPDLIVAAIEGAGWGPPRIEQLADVSWARLLQRPPWERFLGVTPAYLIRAD